MLTHPPAPAGPLHGARVGARQVAAARAGGAGVRRALPGRHHVQDGVRQEAGQLLPRALARHQGAWLADAQSNICHTVCFERIIFPICSHGITENLISLFILIYV